MNARQQLSQAVILAPDTPIAPQAERLLHVTSTKRFNMLK